jgi:peptide deformylase
MAVLQIVTVPDPVLRRKAHKVSEFGKDFQKTVEDMIETLRDAPGVGLAAPQVGLSDQLIVIEYAEDDEDDEGEVEAKPKKLYVVVNPEIVSASEEMVEGLEGCLSVPDLVGTVLRYQSVVVKGLNRFGRPTRIKASDWLARIFQHEIDHLNGVIFTDLTDKVWKPRDEDEVVAD